jgi:DNA primase
MDIVNQHLKDVQRQLSEMGSRYEPAKLKELMEQYRQTQELRNALAKRRGSDVLI